MNFFNVLVLATCSVSVVYGAMYSPAKPSGSLPVEQSADAPLPPLMEDVFGPAHPVPADNATLTAIHHGGHHAVSLQRAVGVAAPLATSDKAVQDSITAEMNRIRRLYPATNMMKMPWDADVAAEAQQWVDRCNFAHPSSSSEKNSYLKTAKFGLGQNIAMGTGSMSWTTAIKLWHDEVKDFVLGSAPSNNAVVGHYTALVWSSSYTVGCGYKLCPAGKLTSQPSHFFVCNFGPAGNIAPKQFTPYEAGTKCAKCQKSCDDGLCTAACPYTNDYSNCEVNSGMIALFPNGCDNVPAQYNQFKNSCKATCQCKSQGLLYSP